MEKKIRILLVIGCLDYCNGITNYCMNYYRKFDHSKYSFDFAIHYLFESEYIKEIENNNDNIYYMGDYSIKSLVTLPKRIRKLLLDNKYDIIHVHILNVAYFYLKQAKKIGIKTRILHAHATNNAEIKRKKFRNTFLAKLGKKYCNKRIACSEAAGDYLFNNDYIVINNAIDYQKYSYSVVYRNEIRNKYSIDNNCCLIGFVGRLAMQKNIFFLLDVFNELKSEDFYYKAIVIGDGDLREQFFNTIKEKKLEDLIIYIEPQPSIEKFYSAFDVFVLPSLYEGLPISGVEAQYSDCYCIFSNKITKELDFSNSIFLEIDDAKKWSDEIKKLNYCKSRKSVKYDKFDIDSQYKSLCDIYKNSKFD